MAAATVLETAKNGNGISEKIISLTVIMIIYEDVFHDQNKTTKGAVTVSSAKSTTVLFCFP